MTVYIRPASFWLLVLWLAGALGACAAPATGTPQLSGAAAQVELDIFSGRPNPTWQLSAAELDTLRQKLAALPASAAQGFPDGLGYRGLIVTLSNPAGGQGSVLHVGGGAAWLAVGPTNTYYADSNRALETWLAQTGQPSLPPDLWTTVQAELAGPPSP